jgi:hypothetical protein
MIIMFYFLTNMIEIDILGLLRFAAHRGQEKEVITMINYSFLDPLRKALRFYAWLALTIFLLQLIGVLMYFINVWPRVRDTLNTGVTLFVCLAFVVVLIRSCLWIRIYLSGAKAFSILRQEGESPDLADRLSPVLTSVTRLLIVSCILDLFFIPVIFLSDVLLPVPVSAWSVGLVYLSLLLFPQAFGIGALILAFLTHQYAQLLSERSQMKEEIELTI